MRCIMNRKSFVIHICYILSGVVLVAEFCKTPNDEPAQCVPLHSCQLLHEALTTKFPPMQFIYESLCGFNDTLMVCCGTSTNFKNQTNRDQRQADIDLLPDNRYCGLQHSDDFAHNLTATLITEFPWMARIASKSNDDGKYYNSSYYKRVFLCLGSIISSRYVLTTVDCAKPEGFTPIEAHLGDYNIANETDCVFETGVMECSEPVGIYKIVKIISHPDHNSNLITNNIALFRLNQSLFFTDYVRPICLPLPGTVFPDPGDILTTSGWGFINHGSKPAVVKKRVLTNMVSVKDCSEKYKRYNGIMIDEKNVCMIKAQNSTEESCVGDSGSPVMFSYKSQWYQIGIVSAGAGGCGSSEFPDILTRVSSYLEWIVKNVEP